MIHSRFVRLKSINIELPAIVESAPDSTTDADIANTRTVSEPPAIDVVSTGVQERDSDLGTRSDGKAIDEDDKETILIDEHCAVDSAHASEAIGGDIASLDAAVAKLNSEVLSLRQESETKAKLDEIVQAAEIASLDAAVEKLNSEVRELVGQSSVDDKAATGGVIPKTRDNRYFDYSLYRETSTSPPPHPLTTYRWEDIKREKEKVQRELTVNFYFGTHLPTPSHPHAHLHAIDELV